MLNEDVQSEPELQLLSTEPIWREQLRVFKFVLNVSYYLVNQVLQLHSSGEVSARVKGEGLHLGTNQFFSIYLLSPG